MKKLLILFSIYFSCVSIISAQDENFLGKYKSAMDNIFSEIQPSKVTTGILIERSIGLTDISTYDCKETSNSSNASEWLKVYQQLYYGHLNYDDFPYNPLMFKMYPKEINEGETIDFGIIFYDYNKISDNSYLNGQISFDKKNNKIIDKSGANENPLEIKSCFVATPLALSINAGSYDFYINPDLFKSNKTASLSNLYIDFDDGNGFTSCDIGSVIAVNYSNAGQKNIKIKAIFNDKEYFSNSSIDVVQPVLQASLYTNKANAKESKNSVNATSQSSGEFVLPDSGPIEYIANGISAEYGIYYRCSNNDNTIRKPYMIVSGFDPMDKNRVGDELITSPFSGKQVAKDSKVNLYRVANKDGYLDKLREDGFDIIIYRSKQSKESIISNGLNLVSFIQKINNEKTSDNELIIAGASMGGLVVRYALAYMEHNNLDHQTKLFISVDSPQEGANIPLGIQEMLTNLNVDLSPIPLSAFSEDLADAVSGLNCIAAQQMLLYHHKGRKPSENKAYCSSERVNFIEELNNVGYFPQNCRSIAVSMGSGTGQSQGFSAGQTVLEKHSQMTPISLLPLPGAQMQIEFEVKSVPDHTLCEIYNEFIGWEQCREIPYPDPSWDDPLGVSYETVCIPIPDIANSEVSIIVDNTMPIDNAPGSIQNLHNTKAFKGNKEILGLEIRDFMDFIGVLDYDPNPDCFIPSYSSVGLLNITNPHLNIKNYLGTNPNVITVSNDQYINKSGIVSLFDVIYIENVNDDHIYHPDNKEGVFSQAMLDFMTKNTSPQDLFIADKTISSGQTVAYDAENTIEAGYNADAENSIFGNVIVESGGSLTLNSNSIKLISGFIARNGSNVKVKPEISGYCPPLTIVSPQTYATIAEESSAPEINKEVAQASAIYDLVTEYSKPVFFYPNPTQDRVFISSNKETNEVFLYDLQGKIIFNQKFIKNTELDMSTLKSGLYLVKVIQNNGNEIVEHIMKQ